MVAACSMIGNGVVADWGADGATPLRLRMAELALSS